MRARIAYINYTKKLRIFNILNYFCVMYMYMYVYIYTGMGFCPGGYSYHLTIDTFTVCFESTCNDWFSHYIFTFKEPGESNDWISWGKALKPPTYDLASQQIELEYEEGGVCGEGTHTSVIHLRCKKGNSTAWLYSLGLKMSPKMYHF